MFKQIKSTLRIIFKKRVMPFIAALFFILFSLQNIQQSFALQADSVTPLVNEQYFHTVHKALRTAKDSIFCVMYLAKYSEKYDSGYPNILINDLIKAHKRGLEVKVILDHNIQFWLRNKKRNKIERKSNSAYKKLQRAGVPVFYDDKKQITHSKILIIDQYITVLGSTNWTYSALNKNNEASILIESSEVAKEFIKRLRLIPRDKVRE